jgi:hypothetical protein
MAKWVKVGKFTFDADTVKHVVDMPGKKPVVEIWLHGDQRNVIELSEAEGAIFRRFFHSEYGVTELGD